MSFISHASDGRTKRSFKVSSIKSSPSKVYPPAPQIPTQYLLCTIRFPNSPPNLPAPYYRNTPPNYQLHNQITKLNRTHNSKHKYLPAKILYITAINLHLHKITMNFLIQIWKGKLLEFSIQSLEVEPSCSKD